MENIPPYVGITFFACVITTFGFLYYASSEASTKRGNVPIIVTTFIAVWIFFISLLALQHYFLDFESMPPRLILWVFFTIVCVVLLFLFKSSRRFIEKMPITTLTYIHIIRVPVEIVLWWLFVHGTVAESMTFEGVNYDILSGISAPFAGLFLVGMKSKSKIAAIIWNLIALGLLINIVTRAVLATPYFYDPLVYEQPNIAVFYFPFVLLPAFIVPAVFFSHIASLYKLFRYQEAED